LAKGATIAPTLLDEGMTLPRVKSNSFTTIPGDAKFSGIFILRSIQNYLQIFIKKGILNGKTLHEQFTSQDIPTQSSMVSFF
jgi:hypothetical protein